MRLELLPCPEQAPVGLLPGPEQTPAGLLPGPEQAPAGLLPLLLLGALGLLPAPSDILLYNTATTLGHLDWTGGSHTSKHRGRRGINIRYIRYKLG